MASIPKAVNGALKTILPVAFVSSFFIVTYGIMQLVGGAHDKLKKPTESKYHG
jgi:hypothetical protein